MEFGAHDGKLTYAGATQQRDMIAALGVPCFASSCIDVHVWLEDATGCVFDCVLDDFGRVFAAADCTADLPFGPFEARTKDELRAAGLLYIPASADVQRRLLKDLLPMAEFFVRLLAAANCDPQAACVMYVTCVERLSRALRPMPASPAAAAAAAAAALAAAGVLIADTPPPIPLRTCAAAGCRVALAPGREQGGCCGACMVAEYCSRACQKAAWSAHKPLCAANVCAT